MPPRLRLYEDAYFVGFQQTDVIYHGDVHMIPT